MLFGQFIGTWDMDIQFYDGSGACVFRGLGEWSFSWILDGRAVQDVLAYADLSDPTRTGVGQRRVGTTLRYYDPRLDAWRMVWLGATSGAFLNLLARRDGEDIMVEGLDMDGSHLLWSFAEITPDRFRWVGRTSKDRHIWRIEQEMLARRRPSGA